MHDRNFETTHTYNIGNDRYPHNQTNHQVRDDVGQILDMDYAHHVQMAHHRYCIVLRNLR